MKSYYFIAHKKYLHDDIVKFAEMCLYERNTSIYKLLFFYYDHGYIFDDLLQCNLIQIINTKTFDYIILDKEEWLAIWNKFPELIALA